MRLIISIIHFLLNSFVFTKKCNSDVIEWIRYLKKTIMPGTRFELAHSFEHRYLKPACLPFHHPGKTKIIIKISVFK